MTVPSSLSTATSDDLLFGSSSPLSPTAAKQEIKDDIDDKEPGGTGPGGVIKANKGMILRKSVEYIR